MSKIPAINEIDANSPSQESTEVVVKVTTVTPDINEIQETISASATIQEIDGTRKPTISEIYKIVNDGLFESTTNWWDYAYKLSQAQLNQDIISRLDNGVIGGGYSKGVDIITTTSNKVPSNTNVYSALKSDSLYPKKLNDEVINGIYDFLNGLTIGKPTAYTGGTWSVDQMGKTHLTTDYLYVRLKAIFETLQILNVDTIGGKLVISPAGSIKVAYVDRIRIDAPVFKHDENTDVWSISQVEDAEGNLVNETLNQEVYRCYFLGEQDGEEIDNKWKVGDQAQAKTFNVKKGTYHKVENSYLWRLVVNVSSDTVDIDGKKYHYVDLSQIDFDSGSDAPAPGDVLNQLGHRLNDTQRQTALVLNAVDNYAPSITLYAGVNYYTLLNKEYVEFGVYNGKAFFNVYGDMYIGDKGENPKTYIKYKNGKINIKANLEIGSSIGDKDLDQYIKENGGVDEETVNNLINNSQVIKDLQKQTDGAIETWFYEGVPTLDNLPAVDWNTSELKKIHIGDLYYDQTTGYAYRFTKYNDDVNPYRWNRIKDNDIVSALDAANRAQITADGKMKVFYGETKPTNYQVGDMWVNATLERKFNNDIARAVADNKTSFNANDWVLASRYSEAIATIQKWTNEYETKFSNLVDEVKQQKDQSIVVWYYDYEPTVDNAPANTWNTDELRSEHIGDIFYDIKNNHSYRWTGTTWIQIKDADFNEAMKAAKAADDKAGAAGDLADSKRRIFYSDTTPTEPFDKGDLWIKRVGDKTETWVYNGTDWVKSDDKALNDFKNAINDELAGIKGQLDGKAETWYQVDDPSTDWTDKASHEGDIWYNTSNGTTNYWNGSAWEQMDIPKDVFDTIDGKSSIFVDSYVDAKAGTGVISKGYKERDLWILPEDATINSVKYYKGDMLTAVSKNTNFDETNWKKKVRYVGPTELNNAIDVVNEKINTINNITIPGINNKFNEFIEDGVLDSSEKARLTDLLNQASNEVAAVIDQVNNITTSKYLTNDNANKGKLEEANAVMKTAWTEYKNLINTLIAANTEITKVNIGEANTKYRNLQEKIKTVKQYLAICQADILSGMGTDITSYKYLKDALNQTTEINGGLVLTSAIQLKDVDKKVTAGMNGIVKGDKTSIAAWYGGPMVDRDTFTSEELETKVPGTDYAMSLLRHDGTGYLAGGNIHWNANGVLSGNFNSFILQGTSMVTMFYYIRLFYLHTANQDSTDFNNIDYVTPMKTFSRLSVLPLGGVEGGNNLPTGLFIGDSNTGGSFQIGNIILRTKSGDPNILEIVSASSNKTAHLGVQGGVSAYGTYTPSTGGGGGLNGTIVPYSTAIASDPQNEGSKIASASSIYKLHSRISNIENNGATSITVTGTGNAITSVSKNGTSITFTKGATFLTSHQSLANYVTIDDSRLSDSRYPKFNNKTWYLVGDDAYIGDHNIGGMFCIKSANNSDVSGIVIYSRDETKGAKLWFDNTNINLDKQLVMNNKRIWIQGVGTAGGNNNRLTLVAGMPSGLAHNTPCRGTILYSNGIAFADPYNSNRNSDSGWIRHLETSINNGTLEIAVGDDNDNEEIHFRWYDTTSTSETIRNDITVPRATGTLALTSQIPTTLPANGGNSDTVDGVHATDGRTFNGNINWSSDWNNVWSDGTHTHPWYGFDHRYENTGAYSTTIADYFGITIKTANTIRLDCNDLLINGTNISNLSVNYANSAGNADTVDGVHMRFTHNTIDTRIPVVSNGNLDYILKSELVGQYNSASATKLQTPRTIWGQSFDGTANVSGSLQIGNIILRTKSGDPNILEIVSASSNKTAHLGVQGGVSAYGTYTPSTGGGGGLNGTIVPYSTAIASDPQNEGSKIASASSIYKLHSRISNIENNGATSITVTGTGNAITSVSKNGTSITFTKGATFLTSHQSLANYVTIDDSRLSDSRYPKFNNKTWYLVGDDAYIGDHNIGGMFCIKSANNSDVSGIVIYSRDETKGAKLWFDNTNINLDKQLVMNNKRIWIQGVGTAGGNNNRLTLVAGMPSGLAHNTPCRGTILYSNGIAFADPYNSNRNSDSGWIRHLETSINNGTLEIAVGDDNDNEEIHFRWYDTTSTSETIRNDITVPRATGTLALTSQIPTTLPANGGNSDTVDGVHATDGRTFNGNINWSSDWNNVWSDGTHTHPWYGFDHRYENTGAYSTTIADYFGITIKTANTIRLDCNDLLINGTNISNLSVNYANSAGNADTVDGVHMRFTHNTIDTRIPVVSNGNLDYILKSELVGQYNSASATKLQTPRTIWGQSFDGTGNVSGSLSEVGNIHFKADNSYDIGSNATASRYIYTNWLGARSGRKLELGANNSGFGQGLCIDTNLNVGIGTNSPAYKLHVVGDIYSSSTIRTAAQNKAIVLSNDENPAWISALSGQVIFNTGNAIRFGATNWEYSDWAGLKYDTVANAIYLGIADGTVFNYHANKRSNGTLKFPGITTITPDSGARIGGSGSDLYLGNANNSNWVKVQDICSQTNSSLWSIRQDGNAYFKNIYSNSATINGNLSVNGLISNKGILPASKEVNDKGPDCYVSADALCSGITAITDSIQVNQVTVQYSNDNGNSWTNYPMSNDAKFNLYANNAGLTQVYLGYDVITGNNDAEKLAQVKKNELIVSFYIPNSCYAQPYFASVDMSNGIYTICTVDILNNSGAVVETYTKRMTGWNQINYISLSASSNNPYGVGNDSRRYIRFRFKHDQNTTTLRNAVINKIRIFSFTKYSFPTDRFMGHTGHIYNFDYNMNTYFPNSILAKGGVTAYQSSDVRLKTNINKLNCLNVIKSIGGTYEFDYIRDHKHSIGFIAQNVNNPLLKDIVAKDDNGYLKINYWNPKLISLAFGALTEIDDEVDKLKARVRELESEVEYLKNKAYALQ